MQTLYLQSTERISQVSNELAAAQERSRTCEAAAHKYRSLYAHEVQSHGQTEALMDGLSTELSAASEALANAQASSGDNSTLKEELRQAENESNCHRHVLNEAGERIQYLYGVVRTHQTTVSELHVEPKRHSSELQAYDNS